MNEKHRDKGVDILTLSAFTDEGPQNVRRVLCWGTRKHVGKKKKIEGLNRNGKGIGKTDYLRMNRNCVVEFISSVVGSSEEKDRDYHSSWERRPGSDTGLPENITLMVYYRSTPSHVGYRMSV